MLFDSVLDGDKSKPELHSFLSAIESGSVFASIATRLRQAYRKTQVLPTGTDLTASNAKLAAAVHDARISASFVESVILSICKPVHDFSTTPSS